MTFRSEKEKRVAYAALDLAGDGKRLSRRAVAMRAGLPLATTHKMLAGLEARGLVDTKSSRPMFHGRMFKIYAEFCDTLDGASKRN